MRHEGRRMTNEPFFQKDGDLFVPTRAGIGPWDKNSLHGRVIIGLLGAEIERRHGSSEYMPARLTVDMYKLPDLSPVEVVTRTIKDGYRIKVIAQTGARPRLTTALRRRKARWAACGRCGRFPEPCAGWSPVAPGWPRCERLWAAIP
jgi:hypothetical protein